MCRAVLSMYCLLKNKQITQSQREFNQNMHLAQSSATEVHAERIYLNRLTPHSFSIDNSAEQFRIRTI